MLSRSRSAAAPDLPTAITIRPQFGSSPAIAVLTSGELAIGEPHLPGVRRGLRAAHPHLDELGRALAVAHHLLREIAHHPGQRLPRTPAAAGRPPSAIGGIAARPVAASSSVSEVEVSPSTVMQLKVASAASADQPLQAAPAPRRRR